VRAIVELPDELAAPIEDATDRSSVSGWMMTIVAASAAGLIGSAERTVMLGTVVAAQAIATQAAATVAALMRAH
jgi:hypothetical protein